jgi:hypothetical protein
MMGGTPDRKPGDLGAPAGYFWDDPFLGRSLGPGPIAADSGYAVDSKENQSLSTQNMILGRDLGLAFA